MMSCYGCKHKLSKDYCECCVGWDKFEGVNTELNKKVDIDRELKLLAKASLNNLFGGSKTDMRIEKVIFNTPATIVIWKDGTKTIVKSGDYDVYDPEKGLAMAIAKKALGNQGNYYEVFKKWLPEEEEIKELPESLKKLIDENAIKPEFTHDGDGVEVTVTDETIKEVERFEEAEEPEIQWLSVKEVADANGLSVEYVRKQIKNGRIRRAEKVNGKWKIPCRVFEDHVEVQCM